MVPVTWAGAAIPQNDIVHVASADLHMKESDRAALLTSHPIRQQDVIPWRNRRNVKAPVRTNHADASAHAAPNIGSLSSSVTCRS